jgi:hypothetical protein
MSMIQSARDTRLLQCRHQRSAVSGSSRRLFASSASNAPVAILVLLDLRLGDELTYGGRFTSGPGLSRFPVGSSRWQVATKRR